MAPFQGRYGIMRRECDEMPRKYKTAQSVLITGASSGIGAALAEACAGRGVRNLFLCGRDSSRLVEVARRCRGPGCAVAARQVDVTDERAMRDWIGECDETAPLELVFANAGIATGAETGENVRRTFATNVGGCLNTVLPAVDVFRRRHGGAERRQIVITSSIAGYAPLSTCPAYAAAKAAVKSWGLSLRGMLKREGISVSVVCPGFVRSRITSVNTCPMPFFMEADRAACIILDRVDRNAGLISFPWPMRFGAWALSVLPWRAAEFMAGLLPDKTSGR